MSLQIDDSLAPSEFYKLFNIKHTSRLDDSLSTINQIREEKSKNGNIKLIKDFIIYIDVHRVPAPHQAVEEIYFTDVFPYKLHEKYKNYPIGTPIEVHRKVIRRYVGKMNNSEQKVEKYRSKSIEPIRTTDQNRIPKKKSTKSKHSNANTDFYSDIPKPVRLVFAKTPTPKISYSSVNNESHLKHRRAKSVEGTPRGQKLHKRTVTMIQKRMNPITGKIQEFLEEEEIFEPADLLHDNSGSFDSDSSTLYIDDSAKTSPTDSEISDGYERKLVLVKKYITVRKKNRKSNARSRSVEKSDDDEQIIEIKVKKHKKPKKKKVFNYIHYIDHKKNGNTISIEVQEEIPAENVKKDGTVIPDGVVHFETDKSAYVRALKPTVMNARGDKILIESKIPLNVRKLPKIDSLPKNRRGNRALVAKTEKVNSRGQISLVDKEIELNDAIDTKDGIIVSPEVQFDENNIPYLNAIKLVLDSKTNSVVPKLVKEPLSSELDDIAYSYKKFDPSTGEDVIYIVQKRKGKKKDPKKRRNMYIHVITHKRNEKTGELEFVESEELCPDSMINENGDVVVSVSRHGKTINKELTPENQDQICKKYKRKLIKRYIHTVNVRRNPKTGEFEQVLSREAVFEPMTEKQANLNLKPVKIRVKRPNGTEYEEEVWEPVDLPDLPLNEVPFVSSEPFKAIKQEDKDLLAAEKQTIEKAMIELTKPKKKKRRLRRVPETYGGEAVVSKKAVRRKLHLDDDDDSDSSSQRAIDRNRPPSIDTDLLLMTPHTYSFGESSPGLEKLSKKKSKKRNAKSSSSSRNSSVESSKKAKKSTKKSSSARKEPSTLNSTYSDLSSKSPKRPSTEPRKSSVEKSRKPSTEKSRNSSVDSSSKSSRRPSTEPRKSSVEKSRRPSTESRKSSVESSSKSSRKPSTEKSRRSSVDSLSKLSRKSSTEKPRKSSAESSSKSRRPSTESRKSSVESKSSRRPSTDSKSSDVSNPLFIPRTESRSSTMYINPSADVDPQNLALIGQINASQAKNNLPYHSLLMSPEVLSKNPSIFFSSPAKYNIIDDDIKRTPNPVTLPKSPYKQNNKVQYEQPWALTPQRDNDFYTKFMETALVDQNNRVVLPIIRRDENGNEEKLNIPVPSDVIIGLDYIAFNPFIHRDSERKPYLIAISREHGPNGEIKNVERRVYIQDEKTQFAFDEKIPDSKRRKDGKLLVTVIKQRKSKRTGEIVDRETEEEIHEPRVATKDFVAINPVIKINKSTGKRYIRVIKQRKNPKTRIIENVEAEEEVPDIPIMMESDLNIQENDVWKVSGHAFRAINRVIHSEGSLINAPCLQEVTKQKSDAKPKILRTIPVVRIRKDPVTGEKMQFTEEENIPEYAIGNSEFIAVDPTVYRRNSGKPYFRAIKHRLNQQTNQMENYECEEMINEKDLQSAPPLKIQDLPKSKSSIPLISIVRVAKNPENGELKWTTIEQEMHFQAISGLDYVCPNQCTYRDQNGRLFVQMIRQRRNPKAKRFENYERNEFIKDTGSEVLHRKVIREARNEMDRPEESLIEDDNQRSDRPKFLYPAFRKRWNPYSGKFELYECKVEASPKLAESDGRFYINVIDMSQAMSGVMAPNVVKKELTPYNFSDFRHLNVKYVRKQEVVIHVKINPNNGYPEAYNKVETLYEPEFSTNTQSVISHLYPKRVEVTRIDHDNISQKPFEAVDKITVYEPSDSEPIISQKEVNAAKQKTNQQQQKFTTPKRNDPFELLPSPLNMFNELTGPLFADVPVKHISPVKSYSAIFMDPSVKNANKKHHRSMSQEKGKSIRRSRSSSIDNILGKEKKKSRAVSTDSHYASSSTKAPKSKNTKKAKTFSLDDELGALSDSYAKTKLISNTRSSLTPLTIPDVIVKKPRRNTSVEEKTRSKSAETKRTKSSSAKKPRNKSAESEIVSSKKPRKSSTASDSIKAKKSSSTDKIKEKKSRSSSAEKPSRRSSSVDEKPEHKRRHSVDSSHKHSRRSSVDENGEKRHRHHHAKTLDESVPALKLSGSSDMDSKHHHRKHRNSTDNSGKHSQRSSSSSRHRHSSAENSIKARDIVLENEEKVEEKPTKSSNASSTKVKVKKLIKKKIKIAKQNSSSDDSMTSSNLTIPDTESQKVGSSGDENIKESENIDSIVPVKSSPKQAPPPPLSVPSSVHVPEQNTLDQLMEQIAKITNPEPEQKPIVTEEPVKVDEHKDADEYEIKLDPPFIPALNNMQPPTEEEPKPKVKQVKKVIKKIKKPIAKKSSEEEDDNKKSKPEQKPVITEEPKKEEIEVKQEETPVDDHQVPAVDIFNPLNEKDSTILVEDPIPSIAAMQSPPESPKSPLESTPEPENPSNEGEVKKKGVKKIIQKVVRSRANSTAAAEPEAAAGKGKKVVRKVVMKKGRKSAADVVNPEQAVERSILLDQNPDNSQENSKPKSDSDSEPEIVLDGIPPEEFKKEEAPLVNSKKSSSSDDEEKKESSPKSKVPPPELSLPEITPITNTDNNPMLELPHVSDLPKFNFPESERQKLSPLNGDNNGYQPFGILTELPPSDDFKFNLGMPTTIDDANPLDGLNLNLSAPTTEPVNNDLPPLDLNLPQISNDPTNNDALQIEMPKLDNLNFSLPSTTNPNNLIQSDLPPLDGSNLNLTLPPIDQTNNDALDGLKLDLSMPSTESTNIDPLNGLNLNLSMPPVEPENNDALNLPKIDDLNLNFSLPTTTDPVPNSLIQSDLPPLDGLNLSLPQASSEPISTDLPPLGDLNLNLPTISNEPASNEVLNNDLQQLSLPPVDLSMLQLSPSLTNNDNNAIAPLPSINDLQLPPLSSLTPEKSNLDPNQLQNIDLPPLEPVKNDLNKKSSNSSSDSDSEDYYRPRRSSIINLEDEGQDEMLGMSKPVDVRKESSSSSSDSDEEKENQKDETQQLEVHFDEKPFELKRENSEKEFIKPVLMSTNEKSSVGSSDDEFRPSVNEDVADSPLKQFATNGFGKSDSDEEEENNSPKKKSSSSSSDDEKKEKTKSVVFTRRASDTSSDDDDSSERAENAITMPTLTIQNYDLGPMSDKENSPEKHFLSDKLQSLVSLEPEPEPEPVETFVDIEDDENSSSSSSSSSSDEEELITTEKKANDEEEEPISPTGTKRKGSQASPPHLDLPQIPNVPVVEEPQPAEIEEKAPEISNISINLPDLKDLSKFADDNKKSSSSSSSSSSSDEENNNIEEEEEEANEIIIEKDKTAHSMPVLGSLPTLDLPPLDKLQTNSPQHASSEIVMPEMPKFGDLPALGDLSALPQLDLNLPHSDSGLAPLPSLDLQALPLQESISSDYFKVLNKTTNNANEFVLPTIHEIPTLENSNGPNLDLPPLGELPSLEVSTSNQETDPQPLEDSPALTLNEATNESLSESTESFGDNGDFLVDSSSLSSSTSSTSSDSSSDDEEFFKEKETKSILVPANHDGTITQDSIILEPLKNNLPPAVPLLGEEKTSQKPQFDPLPIIDLPPLGDIPPVNPPEQKHQFITETHAINTITVENENKKSSSSSSSDSKSQSDDEQSSMPVIDLPALGALPSIESEIKQDEPQPSDMPQLELNLPEIETLPTLDLPPLDDQPTTITNLPEISIVQPIEVAVEQPTKEEDHHSSSSSSSSSSDSDEHDDNEENSNLTPLNEMPALEIKTDVSTNQPDVTVPDLGDLPTLNLPALGALPTIELPPLSDQPTTITDLPEISTVQPIEVEQTANEDHHSSSSSSNAGSDFEEYYEDDVDDGEEINTLTPLREIQTNEENNQDATPNVDEAPKKEIKSSSSSSSSSSDHEDSKDEVPQLGALPTLDLPPLGTLPSLDSPEKFITSSSNEEKEISPLGALPTLDLPHFDAFPTNNVENTHDSTIEAISEINIDAQPNETELKPPVFGNLPQLSLNTAPKSTGSTVKLEIPAPKPGGLTLNIPKLSAEGPQLKPLTLTEQKSIQRFGSLPVFNLPPLTINGSTLTSTPSIPEFGALPTLPTLGGSLPPLTLPKSQSTELKPLGSLPTLNLPNVEEKPKSSSSSDKDENALPALGELPKLDLAPLPNLPSIEVEQIEAKTTVDSPNIGLLPEVNLNENQPASPGPLPTLDAPSIDLSVDQKKSSSSEDEEVKERSVNVEVPALGALPTLDLPPLGELPPLTAPEIKEESPEILALPAANDDQSYSYSYYTDSDSHPTKSETQSEDILAEEEANLPPLSQMPALDLPGLSALPPLDAEAGSEKTEIPAQSVPTIDVNLPELNLSINDDEKPSLNLPEIDALSTIEVKTETQQNEISAPALGALPTLDLPPLGDLPPLNPPEVKEESATPEVLALEVPQVNASLPTEIAENKSSSSSDSSDSDSHSTKSETQSEDIIAEEQQNLPPLSEMPALDLPELGALPTINTEQTEITPPTVPELAENADEKPTIDLPALGALPTLNLPQIEIKSEQTETHNEESVPQIGALPTLDLPPLGTLPSLEPPEIKAESSLPEIPQINATPVENDNKSSSSSSSSNSSDSEHQPEEQQNLPPLSEMPALDIPGLGALPSIDGEKTDVAPPNAPQLNINLPSLELAANENENSLAAPTIDLPALGALPTLNLQQIEIKNGHSETKSGHIEIKSQNVVSTSQHFSSSQHVEIKSQRVEIRQVKTTTTTKTVSQIGSLPALDLPPLGELPALNPPSITIISEESNHQEMPEILVENQEEPKQSEKAPEIVLPDLGDLPPLGQLPELSVLSPNKSSSSSKGEENQTNDEEVKLNVSAPSIPQLSINNSEQAPAFGQMPKLELPPLGALPTLDINNQPPKIDDESKSNNVSIPKFGELPPINLNMSPPVSTGGLAPLQNSSSSNLLELPKIENNLGPLPTLEAPNLDNNNAQSLTMPTIPPLGEIKMPTLNINNSESPKMPEPLSMPTIPTLNVNNNGAQSPGLLQLGPLPQINVSQDVNQSPAGLSLGPLPGLPSINVAGGLSLNIGAMPASPDLPSLPGLPLIPPAAQQPTGERKRKKRLRKKEKMPDFQMIPSKSESSDDEKKEMPQLPELPGLPQIPQNVAEEGNKNLVVVPDLNNPEYEYTYEVKNIYSSGSEEEQIYEIHIVEEEESENEAKKKPNKAPKVIYVVEEESSSEEEDVEVEHITTFIERDEEGNEIGRHHEVTVGGQREHHGKIVKRTRNSDGGYDYEYEAEDYSDDE